MNYRLLITDEDHTVYRFSEVFQTFMNIDDALKVRATDLPLDTEIAELVKWFMPYPASLSTGITTTDKKAQNFISAAPTYPLCKTGPAVNGMNLREITHHT